MELRTNAALRGGGLGGGISRSGEDPARQSITFHVEVDNLRTCLADAVSLGVTEVLPPMDMEVSGSKLAIAGFIDPEGNYIGLVHHD